MIAYYINAIDKTVKEVELPEEQPYFSDEIKRLIGCKEFLITRNKYNTLAVFCDMDFLFNDYIAVRFSLSSVSQFGFGNILILGVIPITGDYARPYVLELKELDVKFHSVGESRELLNDGIRYVTSRQNLK